MDVGGWSALLFARTGSDSSEQGTTPPPQQSPATHTVRMPLPATQARACHFLLNRETPLKPEAEPGAVLHRNDSSLPHHDGCGTRTAASIVRHLALCGSSHLLPSLTFEPVPFLSGDVYMFGPAAP